MKRLPCIILGIILAFGSVLCAAEKRTQTNLPYRFTQVDAFGNTWMLYNGGRLIQQGNMPFCSDAGTLTINNQSVQSTVQTATLEGNEVIFENIRAGQMTITRRFLQQDDGVMRICEIIRNTKSQEAAATVVLGFNTNFGIQNSRQLTDPKRAERTLANLVTDGQGRMALSVFAGRGSKITPTITAQNNNSMFQISMEVKIPANKEVALVHFHQIGASQDQADKLFAQLRETKALASLPPEIRRIVVNYPSTANALDELELLHGGATDVVELSNGDQLKGDILITNWETETTFGKITVPMTQMAGLFTIPGSRPRQLLVTTDDEIIGGKLLTNNVIVQISNGQKVTIPSTQILRIGRRAITPDAPETKPVRPMVLLRTGDRLAFVPPAEPFKIATRFGTVSIPAASISSIDMQPDQSPVHVISLTDGSRFSGLMLADSIPLTLMRGGNLAFAATMIRKITFARDNMDDDNDANALLRLTGDDVLVATIPGKFVMLTPYGDVEVAGAEVKRITRPKNPTEEIQVTLWDDSQISGRLSQTYLECAFAGNTIARVPAGTIESYICNAPQPSSAITERIKRLVKELNADDWKQRERAEAELISVGDAVVLSLKQLRPDQPPEAQQRIDTILKQLAKGAKPAGTVPPMGID